MEWVNIELYREPEAKGLQLMYNAM